MANTSWSAKPLATNIQFMFFRSLLNAEAMSNKVLIPIIPRIIFQNQFPDSNGVWVVVIFRSLLKE